MKSSGRKGQDSGWSLEEVQASFVACARCSFYLSSYRLLHNDLSAAAEQSADGLLRLSWNNSTRKLVEDAFGYRIDSNIAHFEGMCSECRRSFILEVPEDTGVPASFTMEILPGTRAR